MKRLTFITAPLWGALAVVVLCPLFPVTVRSQTLLTSNLGQHGISHSLNPSITNATPAEVAEQVGVVQYAVNCPEGHDQPATVDVAKLSYQRTVAITLEKPGLAYRNIPVLSALLDEAIERAYADCPMFTIGASGSQFETELIGGVDIFARPTADAAMTHVAHTTEFSGVVGRTWDRVFDLYADQQNAATVAEAKAVPVSVVAKPAPRQTAENDQSAYERQRLREQAENQARLDARWEAIQRQNAISLAQIKFIAKVLPVLVGLIWLYIKREPILRFYYFNFHPHPAESAVRSMIATGGDTTGLAREFAEVLGELSPDSSILREVRLEQTDRLVSQMRMASAEREREFARQARSHEIAAYENQAFYGAQTAMGFAVEALEKSKVAYATATKLRRNRL